MDGDRLCKIRWERELKRRRLKKDKLSYLAVPGNTMDGWYKKRQKQKQDEVKRKAARRKRQRANKEQVI